MNGRGYMGLEVTNSIDRRLERLRKKLGGEAEWVPLPTAIPEPPPELVVIYFVGCGDWIKIGSSRLNNICSRLTAIDRIVPYETQYLGEFIAERKREFELHDQFKRFRHKGEWFRKNPELIALIKELCP